MTYEPAEEQDQEEDNREGTILSCEYKCPLCKKRIDISFDFAKLEQDYGELKGVIPHIILHGEPLHTMLCYVDKDMGVRGKGYAVSIGVSRDSNTYQQFTKLWSRSTIRYME